MALNIAKISKSDATETNWNIILEALTAMIIDITCIAS